MNKTKIIELMKDGATFDSNSSKIYHQSLLKGWRKLSQFDVSWSAAYKVLDGSLVKNEGVFSFKNN